MSEDSQFELPEEPPMLQFVESGMQLILEFESLGQIDAALGHTIRFCPVLAVRGWSDHREYAVSLRLKHVADQNREVGRCLLNEDEVAAWRKLLLQMQQHEECSEYETNSFEYVTRHGIRMVWQAGLIWNDAPFFLYVSTMQPAILPRDFIRQLLDIFNAFDLFCSSQK